MEDVCEDLKQGFLNHADPAGSGYTKPAGSGPARNQHG